MQKQHFAMGQVRGAPYPSPTCLPFWRRPYTFCKHDIDSKQ